MLTTSGRAVRTRPRHKADVDAQFPGVRDRLEDRNIVVIGRRKTEGGNDLFQRVQSDIRRKLEFTRQAVQGQQDAVACNIAERLHSVSEQTAALVVIVRGGGGAANRLPFDSVKIAEAIVACEENGVPVITALGHTRDIHLADQVAWCSCTTPTDAATLLNSIWHAKAVVPTLASETAAMPSPTLPSEPAQVSVSWVRDAEPGMPPYPRSGPPSLGTSNRRHRGCLSTVVVLAALLALLVLLVHVFSSSAGTSNDSSSSTPALSAAPSVFASPSKNIVCTATASTVRCDLDTVYYQMKTVPKQCRSTPNWGHVFVLDARGGRMTCPKVRHTSQGRKALTTLVYGHNMKVGGANCTSTANYLEYAHAGSTASGSARKRTALGDVNAR